MANSKLYGIDIQTTIGKRWRVWPEGESELVDEETARKRLGVYRAKLERGEAIYQRKARSVSLIALVEVTFEVVDGAPIGEGKAKDVETRRRVWGWKSEAPKRESRRLAA